MIPRVPSLQRVGWGGPTPSAALGLVQILGTGGVPWALPSADGFKSFLAVQTAGSCCVSIPQTAALLDLIPSTDCLFGDLSFRLWSTKSSPGGAQIPLQGEFKITDSNFNFLSHFFSESPVANKTQ